MCLRAEQGVRIADKTALKMMHEMGISCGIRRETDYHRYNSYRGKVGKTFENVIGRGLRSRRALAEDGHRRHRVQAALGQRPISRRSTTSAARRSSHGPRRCTPTWPSSMSCSTSSYPGSPRAPARYCTPIWAGNTSRPGGAAGWRRPAWCRACPGRGQLHRQRGDRAGVRPHEGRALQGREWPCFEDFKRDLDEYVIHWNTRRRQVKLKGLTPEEFRNQSPMCGVGRQLAVQELQ